MTMDEGIFAARRAKEEAIDRADFEAAANHLDEEREFARTLGRESRIDLEQVEGFCREVIAAAREDLRS
jgi:hypothetical protein